MVFSSPLWMEDEDLLESRSQIVVIKAEPLYETARGKFGEGTIYYLDGEALDFKDLPEDLVKTLGFVLETYLKFQNERRR